MLVSVRSAFPATHRIRIDARGTREPAHAHNWRVQVWIESDEQECGRRAGAALAAWVARYEGRSFNDVAPFDKVNPTAEEVARVVAHEMSEALPGDVVVKVEVGEAAGFSAIYRPNAAAPRRA